MRRLRAHINVYWAFVTNNYTGKRVDVHGRRYKDVYILFGHRAMVSEFLTGNTWLIKAGR